MSSNGTATLPTATPGQRSPDQVKKSILSVPEILVEGSSEDEVQPQKTELQETKITVDGEQVQREGNEDTFTGEWRNGEDDTCNGDDSITRPLKREYQGYYGKKKVNRHRGVRYKEEPPPPRRETAVTQIIEANKREWRLMGFVLFLFILLVATLAAVYHLQLKETPPVHESHNATVSLTALHMEIRNRDGKVVLFGTLWKNLPERPTPYECSSSDRLCLHWKNIKKLEVEHFESGLGTCHRFVWSVLTQDRQNHTDCFELGNDVRWFGGGILKRGSSTLDGLSIPRQPLVTTNIHDAGMFGSVVERYWLSSGGVAILVDTESSFEFSINALDEFQNATDKQLCLYTSRRDLGPYSKRQETGLNYTICVSDNIGQVRVDTLPMLVPNFTDPKQHPDFLFKHPVWSTWAHLKDNFNQSDIDQFSTQIVSTELDGGLFIIDDGWQEAAGDLEFAVSRFPRSKALIEDLHSKGFKVSLSVRLQVSVRSPSFHNATVLHSLVRDFGGDDVPSLTRLWNGPRSNDKWDRGLGGAINLESADAMWMDERLSLLRTECGVDAFQVSGSEVSALPAHSLLRYEPADPNEHTQRGSEMVSHFGSISSATAASRSQQFPVLIRPNGGTSTWNGTGGLQIVIPTAITLGLLGYPVFIPDPVGGSAYDEGVSPSRELYIRWLQVSAFLPIMHLSIPPTLYDSETQTIVKNILDLRSRLVVPEILRIVRDHGGSVQFPVVRPIWWMDPLDMEALGTLTEFLVGNEILVAPILTEGAVHRDIYLPKGVWHDPALDRIYIGPYWLRRYGVSLSSVAYFIRKDITHEYSWT